jgi:hypothetical protein
MRARDLLSLLSLHFSLKGFRDFIEEFGRLAELLLEFVGPAYRLTHVGGHNSFGRFLSRTA